jgi:molybdopterin-containing oxidoreductase family iron-sulfur binding subunit
MSREQSDGARLGMVVDLDACTGCGACMLACAAENNVPPTPAGGIGKAVTWMRVYRATARGAARRDVAFVPVPCQHCDAKTPCVAVCPQTAVELDPQTGIVSQIPPRCLGCRYCMAACPYHARYFNWWDPVWPSGMERTLNPDASARMRGVVEKCNFCQGRLQAAQDRAAAAGRPDPAPAYEPACAEACPNRAIRFGNLTDPDSEVSRLARDPRSFRLLEALGTEPKVHYLSDREWVRDLARTALEHVPLGEPRA